MEPVGALTCNEGVHHHFSSSTTMATPEAYLPAPISEADIQSLLSSISLPPAISAKPLQVTAAFHAIYVLTFSASHAAALSPAPVPNPDGTMSLVLRISGKHIPRIKTSNEVAVLKWIKDTCAPTIPVPAVVRHDTSEDNVLGCEYTLLEKIPGHSVDKIYSQLSDGAKLKLICQLTDVLIELNKYEWKHVGGLQLSNTGEAVAGPVLEDTFWLVPDIAQLWGPDESIETLNPKGPYSSHEGLVQGYLEVFIHAIETHQTLSWLLDDFNPRLRALVSRLPQLAGLNDTRLVLAHKDLHFANVMATEDGTLTGILDWEFAGVVPALRWDPVRAFLWNGSMDESAGPEKERMRQLFEKEMKRRGVEPWWNQSSEATELVWTVIRFVRAIVEVCPRGQKADQVQNWKNSAGEALQKLGV